MSYLEIIILLFIVTDPFGNIPFVLSLLEGCDNSKYQKIIIRELIIAFMVLMLFFWQGDNILDILNIKEGSLNIAGGVVLFLISLKMIFGPDQSYINSESKDDPMIVPIAIPSIAGPSAITVVMLLKSNYRLSFIEGTTCLAIVTGVTWILLAASRKLAVLLGEKGMNAIARLMGMILIIISINMILEGIQEILKNQLAIRCP